MLRIINIEKPSNSECSITGVIFRFPINFIRPDGIIIKMLKCIYFKNKINDEIIPRATPIMPKPLKLLLAKRFAYSSPMKGLLILVNSEIRSLMNLLLVGL